MHELEEEGLVDTKLHQHSCERPTNVAPNERSLVHIRVLDGLESLRIVSALRIVLWDALGLGKDFFMVKPNSCPAMFSYTPGSGNLKWTSIASVFPKEVRSGQAVQCPHAIN